MSKWGVATYGDPCRGCGFNWSISLDDGVGLLAVMPVRYRSLIGNLDGDLHGAGLAWSVNAYVCHVVDNLRIWAERLVGAAEGGDTSIEPYDSDSLAAARRYDSVAIQAALWSLTRATGDWQQAVRVARDRGVLLVHPARGVVDVADVVATNAHDAFHHAWDISRILASAP